MKLTLLISHRGVFAAVALAAAAVLSSAHAANIAPEGRGIIGVKFAIDSTLGTPLEHAGFASAINDLDQNTSVDTFNFAGTEQFSYVGILFDFPRTDSIVSLTLNTAAFFDGGWFGPNNSGPGANGTLMPVHLTAPSVQITLDGGFTWLDAPSTSDWVAALTGTVLPAAFGPPTHANPATVTLSTPQTGVNGIRLIGREGGTASGGFLGVFELGVEAIPEPASALALAAGAGLLALRRPRRT